MSRIPSLIRHLLAVVAILLTLAAVVRLLRLCLRSSVQLEAENLFLRKQLALYRERYIKPRRTTNVTRITMV